MHVLSVLRIVTRLSAYACIKTLPLQTVLACIARRCVMRYVEAVLAMRPEMSWDGSSCCSLAVRDPQSTREGAEVFD